MASKETEVQKEVSQGDAVRIADSKEETEAETALDTSQVRAEEPKATEHNPVHAATEQEAIEDAKADASIEATDVRPEAAATPDVTKPTSTAEDVISAVYLRTTDGAPETETTTTASDTESIPDAPLKSTTGRAPEEALVTQVDLIVRDINKVCAVEVSVEQTPVATRIPRSQLIWIKRTRSWNAR